MTDLQRFWRERTEPLTAVVDQVGDWDAPSPCEGWSARDVLDHLVDTQRDFLSQRGHALPALEAEDPATRWREHTDALLGLLEDPQVAEEPFEGHFGPTTLGEALARFYGFDLLVHRWDIARSQGRDVEFSNGELAVIDQAVDGYGEAAYMPGIFAPAIEVGDDASVQQRVLARTGRRA